MKEVQLIVHILGSNVGYCDNDRIVLLTMGSLEGKNNSGIAGCCYSYDFNKFPSHLQEKLKQYSFLHRSSYSIAERLSKCFLEAYPFAKDENKIWEQISVSYYSVLDYYAENKILCLLKTPNQKLFETSDEEIVKFLKP